MSNVRSLEDVVKKHGGGGGGDDDDPISPTTKSGRVRWNFPLCVLEMVEDTIAASRAKVEAWDRKEDEILARCGSIVRWRVIVFKWDQVAGTERKDWSRVNTWDKPETITEDALYDAHGPGSYKFMVYAITIDPQGVEFQHNTRIVSMKLAARARAAQSSAASVAAPSAPAAPGADLPVKPGSFAEWMQYAESKARLAREEREAAERAEERRIRLQREDDERKEREDERRRLRQREDDDRRDREEERRRARQREDEDRRERDEDRRLRRRDDLQARLLELQGKAAEGKAGTPADQIKSYLSIVKEVKEELGVSGGEGGGKWDVLIENLGAGIGKLVSDENVLEIVRDVFSSKAKLAELELRLNTQHSAANRDDRVTVQQSNPTIPPAYTAPPGPSPARSARPASAPEGADTTEAGGTPAETSSGAQAPESADLAPSVTEDGKPTVIEAGDACPDCGAIVPTCVHYPPEVGDRVAVGDREGEIRRVDAEAARVKIRFDDGRKELHPLSALRVLDEDPSDEDEDDPDACDECPECPHDDDASCDCPPCPHAKVSAVVSRDGRELGTVEVSDRASALEQLKQIAEGNSAEP